MAEIQSKEHGKVFETRRERLVRRVKPIGQLTVLAGTVAAAGAGGWFAHEVWDESQADSLRGDLVEQDSVIMDMQRQVDAAVVLGDAGIRFDDISTVDNRVVVSVVSENHPGCEVGMRFTPERTEQGGWELSLRQEGEDSRSYGNPSANTPQELQRQLDDLCT